MTRPAPLRSPQARPEPESVPGGGGRVPAATRERDWHLGADARSVTAMTIKLVVLYTQPADTGAFD